MQFVGWNGRRLVVDGQLDGGNMLSLCAAHLRSHEQLWREFLRPDADTAESILALATDSAATGGPQVSYSELEKEIVVLKDNEIYRIAEVFRGHKRLANVIRSDARFKGTLLQRWLAMPVPAKPKPGQRSASLVVQIHQFMKDHSIEPLKGLVVHLRAGDAFQDMGLGSAKIRSKLQADIDAELAKRPVTHITLFVALHYGVAVGSKAYPTQGLHRYAYRAENEKANLDALKVFIRAQKVPVVLRSSRQVDEDFCLLCTAERLITTGGGFSKVVGQLHSRIYERQVISKATKTATTHSKLPS